MIAALLQAREQRGLDRLSIQAQGRVGISLSLNMAGLPKSNTLSGEAFRFLQGDLERFMLANRVVLAPSTRFDTDAAGDFYLAGISYHQGDAQQVKALCERFEAEHPLGRLVDADVMDEQGNMVSSHKLKKCLLCHEAAKVCARNATHPLTHLQAHSQQLLQVYLHSQQQQRYHQRLSAAATQALLYELALSPKPGLVHKSGQGAHTDMDFFTFLNAISALAPHWIRLCQLSTQHFAHAEAETEALRLIGIEMEAEMRTATQGINTHKGAIFAIGHLVYACAKLQPHGNTLSTTQLQAYLQTQHAQQMQDALLQSSQTLSHGQRTYQTYGAEKGGGARQQMAMGLPLVFEYALPYLERQDTARLLFSQERYAQEVLQKVLLKIMAHNPDSNILHRTDLQTLEKLQKQCQAALDKNNNFDAAYEKICHFCSQKNMSPGGSADMLAATIFVYNIKHF